MPLKQSVLERRFQLSDKNFLISYKLHILVRPLKTFLNIHTFIRYFLKPNKQINIQSFSVMTENIYQLLLR